MKALCMAIAVLFTSQSMQGRNPFAFGCIAPNGVLAHGKLHDMDIEFDVCIDEKSDVCVQCTEKEKSPST